VAGAWRGVIVVWASVVKATQSLSAVRDVRLDLQGFSLEGRLALPESPSGLVLFAHGSGSSRFSPRNQRVAGELERAGFGTLLFDLLSADEGRDRERVFDISLLAERLQAAADWVGAERDLARLPKGFFGASTGAAAALWAAAELSDRVAAVVSRGGRPDLAGERLALVQAPTLLVVGGNDDVVLELNRAAAARLGAPHELSVVPGAGHLFEEPGALDAVSRLAVEWFGTHLPRHPTV
jgi:putative phosphoribosyl transferase